jgi:type II secretory pathway pseudopilin PulG
MAANARGFTYVGLLLAIALAGTALALAGTFWSTDARREKELELLFVGDQFRQAIAAYYDEVPAGQAHRFPAQLEDLLQDRRWPTTRRHLRRIYLDPMTGKRDWGLVQGTGGGIAGVYSKSEAAPLKRADFPDAYASFATAKDYREWRFAYQPAAKPARDGKGDAKKPGAPAKGGPASGPAVGEN